MCMGMPDAGMVGMGGTAGTAAIGGRAGTGTASGGGATTAADIAPGTNMDTGRPRVKPPVGGKVGGGASAVGGISGGGDDPRESPVGGGADSGGASGGGLALRGGGMCMPYPADVCAEPWDASGASVSGAKAECCVRVGWSNNGGSLTVRACPTSGIVGGGRDTRTLVGKSVRGAAERSNKAARGMSGDGPNALAAPLPPPPPKSELAVSSPAH